MTAPACHIVETKFGPAIEPQAPKQELCRRCGRVVPLNTCQKCADGLAGQYERQEVQG
jgi:hypothetical protein